MKQLLIAFFISSFTLVSAQQDFSVDILTGLDYSSTDKTSLGSDVEISGLYSISLGANFNFRIFDLVMFKTGIRYTKIGETVKLENVRWPSEIGPDGGFIEDPSFPRSINSTLRHSFIEIPLVIRKEFGQKNLSPFFELGMSTLFYNDSEHLSKIDLNESFNKVDYGEFIPTFNTTRITANVSIGANYNIKSSWQLYTQFNFQQYLNRQYNDNTIADLPRIYSLGLEIGIRKQFGSYFSTVKS